MVVSRSMGRYSIYVLLVLAGATLCVFSLHAQNEHPMNYQRWNTFSINKVSTQFNNTGMLCDGNNQSISLARPPAFEYPTGSDVSWGTCVAVVVGAPAEQDPGVVGGQNPDNYPYLDGTMDEGPADFWNDEHFAPYPEFVTSPQALMSNDPDAWPDAWPQLYPDSNDSLLIGSEGWPGFGPGGERVAEVESFAVMYGWSGPKSWGKQITPDTQNRYLKTQLTCRGLAWTGSLYEDFLVWVYVVRNMGTAPIVDLRMGIHADLGYIPAFLGPNYDADRHYYNPDLQLAYSTDDDGYEELPDGRILSRETIPWGGVMALKMPGPTDGVEAYDASHFWEGQTSPHGSGGDPEMYYNWNLLNNSDPHDSDHDGIDDDFWTPGDPEDVAMPNGIPDAAEGSPGYYVGSGADGLQVLGSGAVTLGPGETDTLIFGVVFGDNEDDLLTNAQRLRLLYESNWEVVKAPDASIVEAIPGDRKVTLVWGTNSEEDVQFEGYKVYRSADGGITWGSSSFTDFGGTVHYIPLAQYDLENGLSGHYSTLPEYAWFDLGNDSWVPLRRVVGVDTLPGLDWGNVNQFEVGDTVNIYIDRDVINGLQYRYYVAAYDSGNGIIGPLENTPATDPSEVNNTEEVVPHGVVSEDDLSRVKVVPNPYIVANAWELGKERQIQFIHLPQEATIRIYNTAGERVVTITHTATTAIAPSIASWDLKNYNQQLVAPGLYFYHLESPVGEKTGKFVIVL